MIRTAMLAQAKKRTADPVDPADTHPLAAKYTPSAAHGVAANALHTPSDLFFATAAQVRTGRGMCVDNLPVVFDFVYGDAALGLGLWPLAEQHYQRARRALGSDYLSRHLVKRDDGFQPSIPCRAWLLYQIGAAEVESGSRRSFQSASLHLRNSRSLNPAFYPASIALGVCLVMLDRYEDATKSLRDGLRAGNQSVPFGPWQALDGNEAIVYLSLVVAMRPEWQTARLALLRAQLQHSKTMRKPVQASNDVVAPGSASAANSHVRGLTLSARWPLSSQWTPADELR